MGAVLLDRGELVVTTGEGETRLLQALEAETDLGVVEVLGVVAIVVAIVEFEALVLEELLLGVGPDVDPESKVTATELVVIE